MDARIGSGMAPCLSLRKLFYFATVAEELQISRAAERLHISQPPLTQCIQALERDLGIPLFTRTGHQMKLTEGGRLILTEAKAIFGPEQSGAGDGTSHQTRRNGEPSRVGEEFGIIPTSIQRCDRGLPRGSSKRHHQSGPDA